MNGKQLKNSILQLAIQGKLVPQDPNDEPASELLKRIRKEKEQLVKEGKLKKKDLEVTPIAEDEKPFELPNGWEWCRLGEIMEFINGRAYKKEELLSNGKYKVLRVGNFFTNDAWYYSNLELEEVKYCNKGDLLYAWSASFGPHIWEGNKTIFHYHIWNIRYSKENLYREYLYYFLLNDVNIIKRSTTGSTMIHVSMENMMPRLIPLPPLAEQKRIVAKIEELLPLIDEYGKAQEDLNKLNATLPDKLRQSILQQAIMGKLVPQDPNDEPASELLKRIRKEKEQLVKDGKLKKKDLVTTPITDEEKPFEIPEGWEWCRLKDLGLTNTGTTPSKSNPKYFGDYIPFLGPGDILDGIITYGKNGLSKEGYEVARPVPLNTIIQVCIGGSIGKCAIVNREVTFNQQINSITTLNCSHKYLYYCMQSDFYVKNMIKNSTGTATPIINRGSWDILSIPLPPLSEQHRIVAKIEELFAILK